jgi:tRNA A-37 threonylcarbamoyl transferase component Bud32
VTILILFQTKHYQQIFAQHQLDGFDQLWLKQIDWFEPPNHRRGGWSGVGQLELVSKNDNVLSVFVKKQQNHGRQTLCHPLKGEPTFRREFKRLKFLEEKNINAPKVVFYGEKQIENKACAILTTVTLANFEPLDEVTRQWRASGEVTRQQKQRLLQTVASSVRHFHKTGLVHRALYPKHIFVKNAASAPEVAFIDLEKARFSQFFLYRAYFDLSALSRHAESWTRSERLYFFLKYFQVQRMTPALKRICRFILRRAMRR